MLPRLQTLFNPGDIISLNCITYNHYAVISDRMGPDFKPMLISASSRTGTVREEVWSNVIANEKIKRHPRPHFIEPNLVLANARSQIGRWTYHLANRNCEHFVNWCSGLGLKSRQVKWGASLGVAATLATFFLTEDKRALKTGAGLLVGTSAGVLLGKSTR